jgi:UrcA family protein
MSSSQTEDIVNNRIIKLLPVAAALALCGLAQGATRTQTVPSVVVKYGDLNLDSVEGISRLHARLRGASQEVCSALDSRVLGLRDQYDRCVSDALKRGVADVRNDKLSTFHRWGRRALVASNG